MTLSRRSVTSDLPATSSPLRSLTIASGLPRLEQQISSFFKPYRDERATVRIYEACGGDGQETAPHPPFPILHMLVRLL